MAAGATAAAQFRPGNGPKTAHHPAVCLYSQVLIKVPYDELGQILRSMGADGCDLTVMPADTSRRQQSAVDLMRAIEAVTGVGLDVPVITTAYTSLRRPDDPQRGGDRGRNGRPDIPRRAVEVSAGGRNRGAAGQEVQRDIAGLASLARAVNMAVAIRNVAGENVGAARLGRQHADPRHGSADRRASDFDIGHAVAGGRRRRRGSPGAAAGAAANQDGHGAGFRVEKGRERRRGSRRRVRSAKGWWIGRSFRVAGAVRFTGPISLPVDYQPERRARRDPPRYRFHPQTRGGGAMASRRADRGAPPGWLALIGARRTRSGRSASTPAWRRTTTSRCRPIIREDEWVQARLMYPQHPERALLPLLALYGGVPDWREGGTSWTQDYPRADRHFALGAAAADARPRAVGRAAGQSRRSGRFFQLAVDDRRRDGRLEAHRRPGEDAARIPAARRLPHDGRFLGRRGIRAVRGEHAQGVPGPCRWSISTARTRSSTPCTIWTSATRCRGGGRWTAAGWRSARPGRSAHWMGVYDDKSRLMVAIMFQQRRRGFVGVGGRAAVSREVLGSGDPDRGQLRRVLNDALAPDETGLIGQLGRPPCPSIDAIMPVIAAVPQP